MATEENNNNYPIEYQIFALCLRHPGSINFFHENLKAEIVGINHGENGVFEFYNAILAFHKATQLDIVDPIAFRSWLQTETEIYEALGGHVGTQAMFDILMNIDLSSAESILKVIEHKANKRKQGNFGTLKDVLVTGITVKEVGYDNYYGFEIDGNHKYLMGDFTVTHNTVCMLYVLSKLQGKAIIVVNKIPLMNQWKSEISKFLPGIKVGTLQGQKNVDIHDCDIIVAMLQSMARIDYPDELFKDINVCVIDETHNLGSKVFSQILFKLCCKYTIGLSATPKRADGCEYVFKWHLGNIVYKSNEKREGKPPIIRMLKIDTNDYKEV